MPSQKKTFRNLLSQTFLLIQTFGFSLLKVTIPFAFILWLANNAYFNNTRLIGNIIAAYPRQLYYFLDAFISLFVIFLIIFYCVVILKSIHALDQGRQLRILQIYKDAICIFPSYLFVKLICLTKTLLWTLCLIIPGFIFATFYNFSGIVFLLEGKKGEQALEYSKKIVKTNIIKFLDYLLFIALLLFAWSYPLIALLDRAIDYFFSKGHFVIAQAINCLEIIIVVFVVIYFFVFYYYFYKELKLRTFVNRTGEGNEKRN